MKKFLLVLLVLFSYQFFFGTFIFIFPIEQETNLEYDISVLEEFNDHALAFVNDDNEDALALRLSMINQSTSSIQIAMHRFIDDSSGDLITAALIEKLDQGVEVEIIVDGIMNPNHNIDIYRLLTTHGATLKVYEPKVFILPYKAQNRLHDKFFIFDDTYAIMTGRNIGDRYFTNAETSVHDRDVLFMDQHTISEMVTYFDQLMNDDSAHVLSHENADTEFLGIIQQKLLDYQSNHDLDGLYQTFLNQMIPIDGIMFVHNPVNQFKKEAVLMDTLFDLLNQEKQGIIQSPYIVLDNQLEEQLSLLEDVDLTFITNTIQTSPNVLASSGYIYDRETIAQMYTLYEIQSTQTRHTKTWLIGDEYLAIGSLNIDPRSRSLSTESMVIIKSKELYDETFDYVLTEIDISLAVDDTGDYIVDYTISQIDEKRSKTIIIKIVSFFTYFFHDLL